MKYFLGNASASQLGSKAEEKWNLTFSRRYINNFFFHDNNIHLYKCTQDIKQKKLESYKKQAI